MRTLPKISRLDAVVWAVGVVLVITQVFQGSPRPNGLTLLMLAWIWVAAYRFYRLDQLRSTAADSPANAVNDLLVRSGWAIHSELEGSCFLFTRLGRDDQVVVRANERFTLVQTGHLVDPWIFEPSAQWRITGTIPPSLVEALR